MRQSQKPSARGPEPLIEIVVGDEKAPWTITNNDGVLEIAAAVDLAGLSLLIATLKRYEQMLTEAKQ